MSGSALALVAPYALLLALVWTGYALRRSRRTARAFATLSHSRVEGLMQPASLHPLIDPVRCLGCATCVTACPEKDVLGIIEGKAKLVTPSNCIGHGACKDACPTDAISLVIGTEERGVDIPVLSPEFETNVPGMFVAGELGGMGLIRNGIEQGRQAVDAIEKRMPGKRGDPALLDLAIIGAGPAGFSATLAAKERGLRSVTLEQETLGGTVAHYPRGKIVMTSPAELPIYGKVKLQRTTKEALLTLWEDVADTTGIEIRYAERVEAIERDDDGAFHLITGRDRYRARCVLLAIGRRGTPMKLGIPGEELEKVVYRLIDPEQYRGRSVLVVGGGDSALEAACSLAEVDGTSVALSYRRGGFDRAKPANRARIQGLSAAGRLRVYLASTVEAIAARDVRLATPNGEIHLANDAVLICAGGVLPTSFLESIGIRVETRHGEVE